MTPGAPRDADPRDRDHREPPEPLLLPGPAPGVAPGVGGAPLPRGARGDPPDPRVPTPRPPRHRPDLAPGVSPRARGGPPELPLAPGGGGHPGGRWMDQVVLEGGGSSTLTFPKLSHNDSGLFFCRVESGGETAQSCGTFVRVLEPVPAPFLALRESTKNRILTAQGVLLLLCSAGPGLLLLLRKRWANEQLLHPEKTTCEEENLYEGLNLDECSMYEDISRGVQPTYQDVGTLPGDSQLEKP
ncbi:B-cell antigen receptor complex-associated protein alpha chain-like [Manacus candei]|uniref:B-cell antigen receptor complex-associated protein alpha chain-like n=1 Tax=Manacus candei TaxID=415023 RepID=UPI002226E76C|nr:B-cell antigen receptor complex-associated protein alpha chain-like [Manacus candei]